MECKRRLADGERRFSVEMMGALAGRWSASVGWWMASVSCWMASVGGGDDVSVGWRMECKRRLADGECRLLAAMMQALAGIWSASFG